MKSVNEISTLAVIGAGTMGQGIAQIAAMAGYKTMLFDIEAEATTRGMQIIEKNLRKGIEKGKVTNAQLETTMGNLSVVNNLEEVIADFIIEAIVERLDIKQQVFSTLERVNNEDTIFASNTSSIPITQIASQLQYPGRFVGMHFFNPAHIMKLVEVISGAATDSHTTQITTDLAKKLGKVAVSAKDSPGFIVNRVARHFYVESLKVLEEGVCDVEGIDKLIKSSGFKMGPFELMDLIGVDTNFSVTSSMFDSFHQDEKFRPSRIQQQKVDAGHHGRKSGKGFYDYN